MLKPAPHLVAQGNGKTLRVHGATIGFGLVTFGQCREAGLTTPVIDKGRGT
jgi:hypothetical protein